MTSTRSASQCKHDTPITHDMKSYSLVYTERLLDKEKLHEAVLQITSWECGGLYKGIGLLLPIACIGVQCGIMQCRIIMVECPESAVPCTMP